MATRRQTVLYMYTYAFICTVRFGFDTYLKKGVVDPLMLYIFCRYFQHAHLIPMVGVGKRGAYLLVHGDLPRQHPHGTTLRLTGPVPMDSRQ